MFAGHIGAGLALARAEPRVNVGVFVICALLLDLLLWLFTLLGWESVSIPGNFASTHQAHFVFPYSHGLIASIGWAAVAAAASFLAFTRLGAARLRVSVLIAAAVFSHWLLDWLVHEPELPLAGSNSPKLGLGLWDSMPVALLVEAAIVVAGLAVLLSRSSLPRGRSLGLLALVLVALAFTVVGMTVAPPPPSSQVMAGSSLITLVAVCALACWLGRAPHEPQA